MPRTKKDAIYDIQEEDNLFNNMADFLVSKYGSENTYNSEDAEKRILGIPVPSLATRYLLQSTVWPLGRFAQFVGQEASGKSSFMYEVMRWHGLYGGRSLLLETEQKDAPDLRKAIMQGCKPIVVHRCSTIEDWQSGIFNFLDWCNNQFDGTKASPGPGRIRPMCCGVDSLTGNTCQKLNEEISKEGFASIGFATDANIITRYMKTLPDKVGALPVSIVGTNHLKPGVDQQGRPTRNIPGGKSLKFMETYEIEFVRIGNPWKKAREQGYTVKMQTRKNSLGPAFKDIFVDVLWWYERDDATGLIQQKVVWDWATASIDLMLDLLANSPGPIKEELKSICDLGQISGGSRGKLVWSNALGIPRSDPVTYRQAGILLEDNHDVLTRLYPLLGINVRRVFECGVDLRKQWEYDWDTINTKLKEPVPNRLIWRPTSYEED